MCPARKPTAKEGGGSAPYFSAPWHFLYFLPLPQGQGSLRPTFLPVRRCVGWFDAPAPATGYLRSGFSGMGNQLTTDN